MLFVLSSPLLISRLNVPAVVLRPDISHLRLSLEPETNDPSEYSVPGSVDAVELLNLIPLPIVLRVNTFCAFEFRVASKHHLRLLVRIHHHLVIQLLNHYKLCIH